MEKDKNKIKSILGKIAIVAGVLLFLLSFILPMVVKNVYIFIAPLLAGVGSFAYGIVAGKDTFFKDLKELFDKNKKRNENNPVVRTPEEERMLIEQINTTQGYENYMAKLEYYSAGSESLSELMLTSFGFSKANRKLYDEHKSILIKSVLVLIFCFSCFALALIGGAVGSSLQNKTVTFACMGAGMGGFCIFFFIALFINKFNEYKSTIFLDVEFSRLNDYQLQELHKRFYVHLGAVTNCSMYSQNSVSTGTRRITQTTHITKTIYQVSITPVDIDNLQEVNLSFSPNQIKLYGKEYHMTGEFIVFLRDKKHPKRYFMCAENSVNKLDFNLALQKENTKE